MWMLWCQGFKRFVTVSGIMDIVAGYFCPQREYLVDTYYSLLALCYCSKVADIKSLYMYNPYFHLR